MVDGYDASKVKAERPGKLNIHGDQNENKETKAPVRKRQTKRRELATSINIPYRRTSSTSPSPPAATKGHADATTAKA